MSPRNEPSAPARESTAGTPRFLARLWPKTMLGRQILVLFGALLLVQPVFVFLMLTNQASPLVREPFVRHAAYLAGVVRTIESMPAETRARLPLDPALLPAGVRWIPPGASYRDYVVASDTASQVVSRVFVDQLGPGYQLLQPSGYGVVQLPAVRLPDGSVIEFHGPLPGTPTPGPWIPLGNMLLLLAGLSFGGYIVTRQVTQPLSRLARAAEVLGEDLRAPPVVEEGPVETRQLARAFNSMHERLRLYLDSRTEMLAAMSHDLRTPLTRMRLRAESVSDDDVRERFVDDLAEMDELVQSTLNMLRGEPSQAEATEINVAELVGEIASEFKEVGGAVKTAHDGMTVVRGHRLLLKRALGNVIHNAIVYAGSADVVCGTSEDQVRVLVRDKGPGIPQADLTRIFQPFYRVEGSRNRATGGAGLGLAIAFDAIQRLRGSIRASNRPGGGLEVEILLPRA